MTLVVEVGYEFVHISDVPDVAKIVLPGESRKIVLSWPYLFDSAHKIHVRFDGLYYFPTFRINNFQLSLELTSYYAVS